jgi:D-arginine dehydrogenase
MELAKASIVVVGGGLAGASVAYHLARRGARRLVVLEKEPACGTHASGRNAAMIRQVVAEEPVGALATEGAGFFRQPPADWPVPFVFEQSGSVLLGAGAAWTSLQRWAEAARARGAPAEPRPPDVLRRWIPFLEGADFEGGIVCPTDGVVNLAALLEGYVEGVRRAGGTVMTAAPVTAVETRGGRVAAVVTPAGRIEADVVVDAAGAWALEVARLAGATTPPLRPCRRHLFATGPVPAADRRWPFVWDVTHELYFRPDAGGLLMSACDEVEWGPGDAQVDPAAQRLLEEKVARHAPCLAGVPVVSGKAGLRTLTPDGRFVVGPDPQVAGFFWLAGLGGHGVTTSFAVGALAARLIAEGGEAPAFSPGRFP